MQVHHNPAYSNPQTLGAGLFPASQHNSRVLDQLSEVMSGEQGAAVADYERMQLLVERANTYD